MLYLLNRFNSLNGILMSLLKSYHSFSTPEWLSIRLGRWEMRHLLFLIFFDGRLKCRLDREFVTIDFRSNDEWHYQEIPIKITEQNPYSSDNIFHFKFLIKSLAKIFHITFRSFMKSRFRSTEIKRNFR